MSLSAYREQACDLCRTLTRVDFLVETELFPCARFVCADCEHELVADYHDDASCECDSCDRSRARADRVRREADARRYGDLRAHAHELFGPGWLEEEKQMTAEPEPTLAVEQNPEDEEAFAALEAIEQELVTLRAGPLTRERAGMALLAILARIESGCTAYAQLEHRTGTLILLPREVTR